MKQILFLIFLFLAFDADAGYIDNFHQKIERKTSQHSSGDIDLKVRHRESALTFSASKKAQLYYDVKVINENKVLLEGAGPYSYMTMSPLGTSILLVKIDVESSTKKVIVFAKNKKSQMLFEYPSDIVLDEFDPYTEYSVSDDGKSFMVLSIKEGEGLTNVDVCDVKSKAPKCTPIKVRQDYFLSGAALLEKNRVIILSSNVRVDQVEGQKKYSLSSMIQMFEGESLVWQQTLGNSTEFKWESARISPYKKEFVLYNHNHVEVRDIKTGDLVWKFNRDKAVKIINSMYDIYLEKGHIIIPFANAIDFYRRRLAD